ncbi:unnamed protein product [Musa acuminata var. zebrina]
MATADEAEVTLPVPSPVHVHLTNRDSLLAASATAEHIFALRLDRDAARVETIAGNNFEPWPRDQRGSVRVRKMGISLGALLEPAEEVEGGVRSGRGRRLPWAGARRPRGRRGPSASHLHKGRVGRLDPTPPTIKLAEDVEGVLEEKVFVCVTPSVSVEHVGSDNDEVIV